ncbi:MAG: hypothetical protein OEW62_06685 [Candidatus Bathyarchaeota archaeon]|nr:hypothetical protein [Candidatus Bathyarchaeota archaeon]
MKIVIQGYWGAVVKSVKSVPVDTPCLHNQIEVQAGSSPINKPKRLWI